MALTSVLDISVNDKAFQSFKAVYDQYQAAVKRLPSDWDKADKQIKKSRQSFDDLVASMLKSNAADKMHVAAQKEADRLTRTQADNWRVIARQSKEFTGNIVRATESFLRWVGPVSLVAGLLGAAGGLFGIDRLALSAASQRRAATGLGIGYGQGQAFDLNYSRFVDTRGLLGGVSGALYNATSPGYTGLLAAGLSQQFLSTHNAAEVSASLLERLPALFQGTPRNLVGAKASALGLDNVLPIEDIVRYLNSPASERRAQADAYRKDAAAFNVDKETQRAWQDFITQIHRAGTGIENTFVRGLVPLTEPLKKLSTAFQEAVTAFLGSTVVKDGIKTLSDVLETFAKYAGTEQFKNDVRDFTTGLAEMASTIRKFSGFVRHPFRAPNTVAEAKQEMIEKRKEFDKDPLKWLNPFNWFSSGGVKTIDNPTSSDREAFIKKYAVSKGIDPDLAWHVAKMEGGGTGKTNPNDVDGPSGGDFQLHYNPKHNGVGDQYTARTGHLSTDQKYWQEQDMFALDYIAKNGWKDWSTMKGRPRYEGIGQAPVVKIDNATGGNTIITTNQAINN